MRNRGPDARRCIGHDQPLANNLLDRTGPVGHAPGQLDRVRLCAASRAEPAATATLSAPSYSAAAQPGSPAPPPARSCRASASSPVPVAAVLRAIPGFRPGRPPPSRPIPLPVRPKCRSSGWWRKSKPATRRWKPPQAAWRAAAERYPQVTAWDDPMFGFTVSPGGVGLEQNGGWMVEASQKVPWAGKRALRARRPAPKPMPPAATWAMPGCNWPRPPRWPWPTTTRRRGRRKSIAPRPTLLQRVSPDRQEQVRSGAGHPAGRAPGRR